MDGWDGWDGRLSPSSSLLRAPYGANNVVMKNHNEMMEDDNKMMRLGVSVNVYIG